MVGPELLLQEITGRKHYHMSGEWHHPIDTGEDLSSAQLCVYTVAIFPNFIYWYLCLYKQHYGHACQRHLEDSNENKSEFLLPYFPQVLLLLAQPCWCGSPCQQPCARLAEAVTEPCPRPFSGCPWHRLSLQCSLPAAPGLPWGALRPWLCPLAPLSPQSSGIPHSQSAQSEVVLLLWTPLCSSPMLQAMPALPCHGKGGSLSSCPHSWGLAGAQGAAGMEGNTTHGLPGPNCWRGDSPVLTESHFPCTEHSFPLLSTFHGTC